MIIMSMLEFSADIIVSSHIFESTQSVHLFTFAMFKFWDAFDASLLLRILGIGVSIGVSLLVHFGARLVVRKVR